MILPDGMSLNQELVKQGWCWWYRKYTPGDTVLEGLETEAREAKIGLWADPQPGPPWEWRGLHREDHQGASLIRDLSLISTVDLSGGRPLFTREACVSQH